MNRRSSGLYLATCALLAGCFVPKDAKPGVQLGGEFRSKYVHRGMTLVDAPVFQPRLAVSLPVVTGDTIRLVAKGNVDLSNDTGDAWFPDGHASRFSEIDFIGDYSTQIDGWLNVRGGVFNYNLPNGLEFPFGERGATTEVFAIVSAEVFGATPYFSWHYDVDEVRGAYYRGGITETFPIGEDWEIVADGSLGYASSAQGAWMYGLDNSGLADLRGSIVANYRYDERTRLSAGVHGSAMVDDMFREIADDDFNKWFNDLRISSSPIWFTLGVTWVF